MLEKQLEEDENSYFDDSARDKLLRKLNEIKSHANDLSGEHIDFDEYGTSVADEKLKVSEIVELLRKNQKPIPDICCFHCPRLRKSLVRTSKFANGSFQDLIKEESCKFQTISQHKPKGSIDISNPQNKSSKCKDAVISPIASAKNAHQTREENKTLNNNLKTIFTIDHSVDPKVRFTLILEKA